MEAVERLASIFSSQDEVSYKGDGIATVDVRQAIDTGISNGLDPVFAASERLDERWPIHAEIKDMTWSRDCRGQPYNFDGAVICERCATPSGRSIMN